MRPFVRPFSTLFATLLLWLTLVSPLRAETDAIEVFFLPMNEAAEAAASQLSDTGKIAMIESRRLLLIDDDVGHLKKIRRLLKQLDTPMPQFVAHVEIEDMSTQTVRRALLSGAVQAGRLPGGWVRLSIGSGTGVSSDARRFQLRITGNEPGSIEAGIIQPVDRQVMVWLAGYGVLPANSVEMIPITSGFRIQAWPAGADAVRVRITPWMQRLQPKVSAQQEMLIDLGTPHSRVNAAPRPQQPIIEIRGAGTEVTIPVDQQVTIAAMSAEARNLGTALLSGESTAGNRSFAIRLRMSRP